MESDILLLTKKFISTPSEKNNREAIGKIINEAESLLTEFKVHRFEKNNSPSLLVTNSKKSTRDFKIILNAHLDVVPGTKQQYKPFVKAGKLYGRGAYDTKAAAAVMILLFKEIARSLSYPLALQIVADEETGGFNGTKYQIENGVRGEFIIACENTDLLINNESRGIIWMNLQTTGKTAHGAYPWLGKNAVWEMYKNLDNILKLFPIPEKEIWKTTINVAKVFTQNQTYNKVPDSCEAGLDIRYIPEDSKHIETSLRKILTKDTKMKILLNEPSHFSDPNNEFIKQLMSAYTKVTDKKASLVKKHGASDVRHYTAAGGNGVCFGPVGGNHHADEEWVDIESLATYYSILKTFLLSIQ